MNDEEPVQRRGFTLLRIWPWKNRLACFSLESCELYFSKMSQNRPRSAAGIIPNFVKAIALTSLAVGAVAYQYMTMNQCVDKFNFNWRVTVTFHLDIWILCTALAPLHEGQKILLSIQQQKHSLPQLKAKSSKANFPILTVSLIKSLCGVNSDSKPGG